MLSSSVRSKKGDVAILGQKHVKSPKQIDLRDPQAPSPVMAIPGVIGYVDHIDTVEIRGWSHDTLGRNSFVQLDLVIDGLWCARTTAHLYRPDLFALNYNGGAAGFCFRTPETIKDGRPHHIEVVELITNTSLKATKDLLTEQVTFVPERNAVDISDFYRLFDTDYYLTQSLGCVDPLRHYREIGWKANLNPHPLFDTEYYLSLYEVSNDSDPLEHFFLTGHRRLHETHPLFDCKSYAKARRDVLEAGQHPLLHFLSHGANERMQVSEFFDASYYERQAPGIRDAGFAPLVHYLRFGAWQGLRPHPDFDPQTFRRLVDLSGTKEAYSHFIKFILGRRLAFVRKQEIVKLSVVMLNLNKHILTLQALYFLLASAGVDGIEVIVVDNGSDSQSFASLFRSVFGVKWIRLDTNRGFGEANNLACEAANGELMLLLNNDAFVTQGFLPPLLAALQDKTVGAAGPKFIYPNGLLQEAGCTIAPCGTVTQRGKFLDARSDIFDVGGPSVVDFCSAAALLVRRQEYLSVLGFDLCWDPAYYEDVDLCLKLRIAGLKTLYVPESIVYHIENGTSGDRGLDLRLENMVAINRLKFVSRWSEYLSGRSDGQNERALILQQTTETCETNLPTLALYTPYPLTPGGGERYLLGMAHATVGLFNCTVLTPDPYSQLRLSTMARELQLNLSHAVISSLGVGPATCEFDVFIVMGNEVFPSVRGLGKTNIYYCQFPFPLESGHFTHSWNKIAGYDLIITNSKFAAKHTKIALEALSMGHVRVETLHPAVPQVGKRHIRLPANDGPLIILNVGRFTAGGHCKRQDSMIHAFRELSTLVSCPLELHLAGALGGDPSARAYLANLEEAARGLPVYLHLNPSAEFIHEKYQRATVYWHLTGMNASPALEPELFEHFGITICEAMSAGVIPIAIGSGGPAEIITDGWDGYLVNSHEQLVARTKAVLCSTASQRLELSNQASNTAARYSPEQFRRELLQLIAGPTQ